MTYADLSPRQTTAMLWWKMPAYRDLDGIICDGAVRSGKTISMVVGFILWSMETYDGQLFGMCGKTVESFRRNVVINLRTWLPSDYRVTERRSENLVIIEHGKRKNHYFIFGGRDESSYTLVQGMTLAGAFLDEVALMPQSFVEQVLARCSVEGSKYWFNCNPGSPQHWFYLEWVKKSRQKKVLRLHFTMADNYGLSPTIRERYEGLYTGVFYRRYILGEWCLADGLVYSFFDKSIHTIEKPAEKEAAAWFISVDYGTHNPTSMGLWMIDDRGRGIRVAEYYHSGRATNREKTPEEYYTELERLAGSRAIEAVVVDPAAAEFIATIRRHGKYSVRKAKNKVIPGINLTATALKSGFLLIGQGCKDCIREFALYSWDEKKTTDTVIKENDHSMDETRYFVTTILRRYSGQFRQYLKENGYREDKDDD